MDLHLVIGFVVAAALLSIIPGQDMLFIISNAIVGGRRTGVLCAVGVSTGIAVHTFAAAFGLSALIGAAPVALEVIRWAGAAVLVYFAVSTWLASRRHLVEVTADQPVPPARSAARTYVLAVLTNVANPKVIIFYLAFVPQFVTTAEGSWPVASQFLALGGLLIVVGLTVDSGVGMLAGTAADLIRRHRRVRVWLDRASAAVFGALAARLVADNQ